MKSLTAMDVASVSILASGVLQAQTGGMMDGGRMRGGGWMGGYGGYWGPILLVVVGLVVWVVLSKRSDPMVRMPSCRDGP